MSKNILAYFLLWILLQVLVDVNCQLIPFKPSGLFRHTATFIDNKLYILGGTLASNDTLVKGFFYLDISVPFNTQELSWQDLSSINKVPLHSSATSAKGGANNDTLFLYGGFSNDPTMALVYTFDPQHIVWNPQKITGINAKYKLTGVMRDNGKFYLWGGITSNNIIVNEMLILDTINLNWGTGSSVNAPTPRYHFGATLLPNNKIIYIGGLDDLTSLFNGKTLYIIKGTALSLKEVYIYDTINDNWDTKITSGKIPSNRAAFSTVLGLDGQRIIIYGGIFNDPGGYVDTTLYVLDLTNFNWDIPKIKGNIPKPRAFHKANIISRYMVITFGRGYDRAVESDILLLDISNNEEYVWMTSFDPSPLPSSSSQTSNNSSDNSKMVGAIVGSLLSGIFLSVGGFFLYKWNKKRQSQNNMNNYNNYGQEEKAIPTERDIHSRNENITNHEPIITASTVVKRSNFNT
ncbi:unnamed protein product [Rhizophagus irregularis]|uniref:Galactose oxidase n=1 Tax=Rhizophagus irregularis TaxID=588596 RepID=A0A2N1NGL5_9GLOM|nr:galactose oxidase [Rhizophagus irregularis]CAB4399938.1 unnamed protein product [Rhizophagus irregularis]CAB5392927.1 unnamed protein product [Rhizophagus irregularis]